MRTPPERRLARVAVAAAVLLAGEGCTGGFFSGIRNGNESAPAPVRPVSSEAGLLSQYLQLLQRLVQGTASEQAEIVAAAQNAYETAPTPSKELKLALILATPGHGATNLPRAQGLLRELMAHPETLLPGERALAFLELSQIDDHLTLVSENRRLQAEAASEQQTLAASSQHRLQQEQDENARLRKELDEAKAKLDAIANIERSLNERKPNTDPRP
ncbi:MAG TPA: hypothetical protein VEU54_10420 [Steroidobacteraceae bacterium]|nr:hypothetical protein [Steroidobacteraceae bacterium]